MKSAVMPIDPPLAPTGFSYDASSVEWKKFFTQGTWYRILHVDVAARQADMLVKFDGMAPAAFHLKPPVKFRETFL